VDIRRGGEAKTTVRPASWLSFGCLVLAFCGSQPVALLTGIGCEHSAADPTVAAAATTTIAMNVVAGTAAAWS